MFFINERVSEHITRIRDLSLTASYLITGSEKTALIDTGIGYGSIRKHINSELDKDANLVILTHGHLDHASGAESFSDVPVYLNENDRELMNRHVFDKQLRFDYIKTMHNRIKMPLPEPVFDDLIDGFDSNNTLPLNDGDVFDLGGITLQMIHVPGHTMGSMMVLIKEERTILFGDACGPGVLLVEDECATVRQYRDRLRNVKGYEYLYDHVLRNHDTCESQKSILGNVIEVCDEILEGRDDRIPASSFLTDKPVYQAKKTLPGTRKRADGMEGNITYLESRIT